VYNTSARQLLSDLGRKISQHSGRGSQRDELSLSEMLSAGAAFQRSFTEQQLVCRPLTAWTDGHTEHVIFLIFKLPWEYTYRG